MLPNTAVNPERYETMLQDQSADLTYSIDFTTNRIVGRCDETAALRQTIYCIIRTERYRYLIYSRNYGMQRDDLYGKDKRFVLPQLQKRITEALLQDDRILSVRGFSFLTDRGKYQVSFTVDTIYTEQIDITDEVVI